MLEKAHIAAILRELKKLGKMHSQSMTFGSKNMNGTPDRYFDGAKRDLWIEFKRLASMPRNGVAIGEYSDLQIEWLQRRWTATYGCNAWGIVGLPNKTVCIQSYPATWRLGTSTAEAVSHKTAALLIWEFCNGSTGVSKSKSTQIRPDNGRSQKISGTRGHDTSIANSPKRTIICAIRQPIRSSKKKS